jgi:hypothetical protein
MKKNPLQKIPGVGPSIAKDLRDIGIVSIHDLKDKNPDKLYESLMRKVGNHVDRCVLYVFRCAVYYANGGNETEKLKWWYWKDKPKS